jgi:hypothetical protein
LVEVHRVVCIYLFVAICSGSTREISTRLLATTRMNRAKRRLLYVLSRETTAADEASLELAAESK